ncbi:MAG TPA: sigma-70 family RNA polymerase sigma factor [Fimbriimonadaceae bacterium]|nr:sigma-70 family RNA polymerase sigma factor [Fimbriimonadaceae bacterium]
MQPPIRPDLPRLLERCRKGDRRAWNELVEGTESLVYSIPRRMGLSPEDCEDVFQDTFLSLLKNLDRIQDPFALPRWLGVTASNFALQIVRVRSRAQLQDLADASLEDLIAGEELAADRSAETAERADLARIAIDALPEKCRKLLTLLFFEDKMDYQTVADMLGIPIGAIGPTRARCLEKVRVRLKELGFFD